MRGKRKTLYFGYHLLLGGIDYEIEKVEGMGGNAIVYRASYEDDLNKGKYHQVLIKELFPYETRGWVFRDESGAIICQEEGKEWFQRHRQSFLHGNEVNLELLEKEPDEVLGNLNSYEAYGTLYSVLTLHGGKTLKEILEKKERFVRLEEMAQGMIDIVSSLSVFHNHGFLHLDISPDNILVMPKRMLLIDYNSVWTIDGREKEERYFSIKDGYSAPEVRLRSEEEICEASDLYSVCAVFFEMVTGKRLSDEEIIGNGLKKCLKKTYACFENAPPLAVQQGIRILMHGLHPVVRRRYQNTEQLKKDFEELVDRIEGVGITHSALWESSRTHFLQIKGGIKDRSSYIDRTIKTDTQKEIPTQLLKEKLGNGAKMLLTGNGGMGKTSFLMQIWEEEIRSYRSAAPVWCYLSLADYQHEPGETSYIKKCLLSRLSFGKETRDMEGAVDRLKKVLKNENGKHGNTILLLDGFNEAGSRRSHLMLEIEELAAYKNLGILLTDRSEDIRRYAIQKFKTIRLEPLKREEIISYLERSGICCKEGEAFFSLLQNPMMMGLYEKTVKIKMEENAKEEMRSETILATSADRMMESYFQSLYEQERRQDSGDEQAQLCYSYISEHLLTAIAAWMSKKGKTVLTLEELYRIVKKNYQNLKNTVFTKAFEEYLGKSRIMMRGIKDEQEWFDYTVSEELIEKRHFLEKTEQGGFRLSHDNFIPFLKKKEEQNKKRYRSYLRKRYALKGVAAFGCFCLLVFGGKKIWDRNRPFPATETEIRIVKNAMSRLTWNLGILERQLSSQREIIERAMQQDILEKEEDGMEELKIQMERTKDTLEAAMLSVRSGESWIEQLETKRNTIALDTLQTLYERPRMLQIQIEAAMEHLESNLCEESPYQTQEQRKKLLEAYDEYLDCYVNLCYLELQYVLQPLGEEKKEVTDFLVQSSIFAEKILQDSLSDQTQEQLQQRIKAVQNACAEAENEMRRQNYEIVASE